MVGINILDMKSIESRLQKILNEFGIENSQYRKTADYYFDLNMDVLDLMSLSRKIKREFMVDIPDSEILRMERVSDTIYFLEKKSNIMFSYN